MTTNQKPQDEATALREYGLRIAEAVRERCAIEAATSSPLHAPRHIRQVSVAAIVVSVELPEQEMATDDSRLAAAEETMRHWAKYAQDGHRAAYDRAARWLEACRLGPPPSAPSPADAREGNK